MSSVEQVSQAILRDLVADFTDRNLAAHDLGHYVGVTLPALRQTCCGETSASPVDFDLALKDLEKGDLIQTGPMVAYDNPPNASVVIIGLRSKYEYASLTEKGYKAAQKTRHPNRAQSTIPVHFSS